MTGRGEGGFDSDSEGPSLEYAAEVVPSDETALVRQLERSIIGGNIPPSELESALRYARQSKSPATWRCYKSDWRLFCEWCGRRSIVPLPSPPPIVAVYASWMADAGLRPSTIERAVAAIALFNRTAGHPFDRKEARLSAAIDGIRREKGTAPQKKAPLSPVQLVQVVETFPKTRRGLRDRAIVTSLFWGARRRSEIAALDVEDVEFTPEGTITLLVGGRTAGGEVRRTKANQEGAQEIYELPPFEEEIRICPVAAMRDHLDASGFTEGALFRWGTEKRITGRAIAEIIQRATTKLGLENPDRKPGERYVFGGHSGRSGFATTAAKQGKSVEQIMRQTGHASYDVALEYVQPTRRLENNAVVGLRLEAGKKEEPTAVIAAKLEAIEAKLEAMTSPKREEDSEPPPPETEITDPDAVASGSRSEPALPQKLVRRSRKVVHEPAAERPASPEEVQRGVERLRGRFEK